MFKTTLLTLIVTFCIYTQSAAAKPKTIKVSHLQNRPAIMLKINDFKPMLFLVDTGFGGKIMLDNSVAKSLELEHLASRTVNNLGMGNITIESYAGVELKVEDITINLDEIEAQKNMSQMLNQMGTDKHGNKPVGVVSPWLLTQGTITFYSDGLSIEIDDEASLEQSDPSVLNYNFAAGIPAFQSNIGGKSYRTHLDTGSPTQLILPSKLINDFEYLEEPQKRGGAQTAGRKHNLWTAKLKGKVNISNITFDNPDVLFIEAFPAVNVGLKALKNGSVTIDRKNQLIKFQVQG